MKQCVAGWGWGGGRLNFQILNECYSAEHMLFLFCYNLIVYLCICLFDFIYWHFLCFMYFVLVVLAFAYVVLCCCVLEVIKQWTCAMDSPVTSLHFFTQRKIVPVPPCLKQILGIQRVASSCVVDLRGSREVPFCFPLKREMTLPLPIKIPRKQAGGV